MLKTFVPAEDEYNSFTRPAVYDSIKKVLKFYGLEDTSRIFYNGENEIAKLVGSDATDKRLTDIHTDGVYGNKLFVTAEFTDTEFNNGYANQRRGPTERPVWMTKGKNPIAIYPGFVGIKVDVGITAVFNSLKTAEQFRKRIQRQQSNQMVDFSFDPTIHLGLNNSILELMEDLHKLYVKNEPTTPTLGDWFNDNSKTPFTTISNVAGNHKRIVAPMKLSDVGIIFGDTTLERTRKNSTYGKFEVEVKYHFYLNSFSHWELEYPLNVYQDEIPAKWIPRPQESHVNTSSVRVNQETAFGDIITGGKKSPPPFYLKLPQHDPWVFKQRRHIQPVLQARLKLKDVDEQVMVQEIFKIPGFKWSKAVAEYILFNREHAFNRHDTLFPITFYSNDIPVLPSDLVMDEEGVITMTRSPVMKNTYRMVVCIDFAIREYSDKLWETIRNNPEFFELIKKIFYWYDWKTLEEQDWYYNPDGSINFGEVIFELTAAISMGGPTGINSGSSLGRNGTPIGGGTYGGCTDSGVDKHRRIPVNFNRYTAGANINSYTIIERVR